MTRPGALQARTGRRGRRRRVFFMSTPSSPPADLVFLEACAHEVETTAGASAPPGDQPAGTRTRRRPLRSSTRGGSKSRRSLKCVGPLCCGTTDAGFADDFPPPAARARFPRADGRPGGGEHLGRLGGRGGARRPGVLPFEEAGGRVPRATPGRGFLGGGSGRRSRRSAPAISAWPAVPGWISVRSSPAGLFLLGLGPGPA